MTQVTYIPIILLIALLIINPCFATPVAFVPFLSGDIFSNPPGACLPGMGNYTKGSAYESNLSTVISKLTAAAAASKSFANATAGSGRNKVYASYYCHQDVNPRDCLTCVRNSSAIFSEKCTKIGAIFYTSNCTVRYANRPIFPQDDRASLLSCDREGPRIPDPESFNQRVTSMLERLVGQVGLSGDRHQSSADDWIVDQKVYTAVWCMPAGVVSGSECADCLSRALNETTQCLSEGKTYGIDLRPNCRMRYDLQPFGDFLSPAPAPAPAFVPAPLSQGLSPSASPNSSSHGSISSGSRSLLWIIAIAVILTKNLMGP